MKQRTGTARSSASEGYLMEKYTELWHHIQRYKVDSFDAGLESLRYDFFFYSIHFIHMFTPIIMIIINTHWIHTHTQDINTHKWTN